MVGLATAHLEPGGLPLAFGGGGGGGPGGGIQGIAAGAGVDHRGRLRHRRLAGGLDGPRRLADDDQGRLKDRFSRTDVRPVPSGCPQVPVS